MQLPRELMRRQVMLRLSTSYGSQTLWGSYWLTLQRFIPKLSGKGFELFLRNMSRKLVAAIAPQ